MEAENTHAIHKSCFLCEACGKFLSTTKQIFAHYDFYNLWQNKVKGPKTASTPTRAVPAFGCSKNK